MRQLSRSSSARPAMTAAAVVMPAAGSRYAAHRVPVRGAAAAPCAEDHAEAGAW